MQGWSQLNIVSIGSRQPQPAGVECVVVFVFQRTAIIQAVQRLSGREREAIGLMIGQSGKRARKRERVGMALCPQSDLRRQSVAK